MRKIVLKLILFYKRHISGSTGLGNHCRFIPSCSEYTYEAVNKYGVSKGLSLGFKRILKCHPWGGKGVDLLK